METAEVRTSDGFTGSLSPKRNRHSSKACTCCRKLKIRCSGGEAATLGSASSTQRRCNHCVSQSKTCVWPPDDGRKRARTSSSKSAISRSKKDELRVESSCSKLTPPSRYSIPHQDSSASDIVARGNRDSESPALSGDANDKTSIGLRLDSLASQLPYTTVYYHRHLGPTAIAPGHKKISLKARQDCGGDKNSPTSSTSSQRRHDGLLPLFDATTDLPVKELQPSLLDKFYEYYADTYCFLSSRKQLESLIEQGKASAFLVCVISALSSRFCSSEIFSYYLPPTADGSSRQPWELASPFLEKAKALTMSALNLPSTDVVAGLLMLAWADFGDNNEAGLWMFTGMALRMAIELGLHRRRNCLDLEQPQSEVETMQADSQASHVSDTIHLKDYEESCQLLLFWTVFSLDTALCNGTGRVPGLKLHEINIRLPNDADLARVRAGPGGHLRLSLPEAFPHMSRMFLIYAQCLDFLNTSSRQIRFQANSSTEHKVEGVEELKRLVLEAYKLVPKELRFGANCYQAAVQARQSAPYLLLHLQYHLIIAFLTQESLAGEEASLAKHVETSSELQKTNRDLYRNAIKSITDMVTFVKLIDNRPLLATVYLNQAFFHAACAYSRDMFQSKSPVHENTTDPVLPKDDLSPTAFPIPSQTSPSMMFYFDEDFQDLRCLALQNESQVATESTYSYLSLIAKANYQFLRQAIKDQAQFYAGSGWVDAVLDQREKGLRDVDLSIVSESIGTFIRLHDLREPGGSANAFKKFILPPSGKAAQSGPALGEHNEPWVELPCDFLADAELDFDPQAFFNDYMFTELAYKDSFELSTNGYGSPVRNIGTKLMHDGLDVLPLPEDLQTCVGLILDRKDRNLLSHNRDVVVPGIPKRSSVMSPIADTGVESAALVRRQALTGASGPAALVKNVRVFGIACFACLGGFVYGYNQGVFSGILTMTSFGKHMGPWVVDQTKKGWLTSIFELGAWFGCLYSGFLAETLSRKRAIQANVVLFVIGVIVQCLGVIGGASCILGGRFITGLAVGAMSVNVPNYNAEVAPPEVRGSLVALQQLAITAGIMVSFWIDYGTNNIGGTGSTQSDAAWLVPICLQLIPGVALGVGLLFMPFSPRWLIHHGREVEARHVLSNLRNLHQDHELIELEFLEIKAQSLFEKRSTAIKWPHLVEPTPWNTFKLQFVAIGSLFTTRAMFRRVIVATVTMFFQQFTGINAVLYYAPSIFAALGTSSNTTSLLATGVVGVAMFLATIPAVLYIDKLGRKPVMLTGAVGMGICHTIIAILFGINQHQWATHKAAGWAAVTFVWLFVVNFGYSWGPCGWVIISEVWPLSNRAYGIALGASSNWMSNFIVGQITPIMLQKITYGTFIFFGILTFGGAVFVWLVVPETKRLTLEEMDVLFGSMGVAVADSQRMVEINEEIGLNAVLAGIGMEATASDDGKADRGSEDGKSGGTEKTKEIEVVG